MQESTILADSSLGFQSLSALRESLDLVSTAIPRDLLSKVSTDNTSANSPVPRDAPKDASAKNSCVSTGKLGIKAVFDPSSGALMVSF